MNVQKFIANHKSRARSYRGHNGLESQFSASDTGGRDSDNISYCSAHNGSGTKDNMEIDAVTKEIDFSCTMYTTDKDTKRQ